MGVRRDRARAGAHRPARPLDARPRPRTRRPGPALADVRPRALGRAIQAGSPGVLARSLTRRGYIIGGVPLSPSSAARLATQLECLPALLEGAAPGALDRRTRSGKWSVRENLAHLARHHRVMLDRVRKVLAEDRPRLPRYAAEEDAEWPAWAALPVDEVRGRL